MNFAEKYRATFQRNNSGFANSFLRNISVWLLQFLALGELWHCQYTNETWTVLISWSQPVKICWVIFMAVNWFQTFTGTLKDYRSGSSKKSADFSPRMFSYFKCVFRIVSTIKDGGSWKNSQRFPSKMEPFCENKTRKLFLQNTPF